jgi:two-component system sensor histidine kinase AlgZ
VKPDPTPTTRELCQPARVLRLVLAVQIPLIPLVLLLAPAGMWLGRQAAVSLAALGATLGWLGLMCLLQPVWQAWSRAQQSVLAGVAGAGVAWLAQRVLDSLMLIEPLGALSRADVGALCCGASAALLVWFWLHEREQRQQPAQSQARLAELQARIRPHFLFNALNAVLILIRLDPDRAERVLEDLSALFRQAMAETASAVSLATEVDLAKRYIAIEQVRFGDRLRVSWDIEPATLAARVPPLVLQPLVENAVKHGVEPSTQGARIRVTAQAVNGLVRLTVNNTLSEAPSHPGSGMALANVAERLKLLHDLAAHVESGIVTDPTHGQRFFVTRLTFPL